MNNEQGENTSMHMHQSEDGKWYHGRSSHDGYVIVPANMVEQRYHDWEKEHPHATQKMTQEMKELLWAANLWDTYAQQEPKITILEVYAVVEEQVDHHWHLYYRFWQKTIESETIDEQSLKAWLRHKKAQQILQSGPHPLSGVYMIERNTP